VHAQVKRADSATGALQKFTDGKYEIPFDRDGGSYEVEIEATGYVPVGAKDLTFKDGSVVFDARMKKSAGLGGMVLLPDGKPAAGADVLLGMGDDRRLVRVAELRGGALSDAHARTDKEGRFVLPPKAGDVRVSVLHDAGWADVSLPGDASNATIELTPYAVVEGRAVMGGKPLAGTDVEVMPIFEREEIAARGPRMMVKQDSGQWMAKMDAEGRFKVHGLIDGEYRLSIRLGERTADPFSTTSAYTMELRLKPGEHAVLTLGGSGRPVTGKLTRGRDAESVELPRWGTLRVPMPIYLRPANWTKLNDTEKRLLMDAFHESPVYKAYTSEPTQYAVDIQRDGTFRAEDVPAGKYLLDINVQARIPEDQNGYHIVASAGKEVTVPEMAGGTMAEALDIGTVEMHTTYRPKAGEQAPAYEAVTYEGGKWRLADMKGKYVLLDFWATWCGPCITEMEHLRELDATLGKAGKLAVVSVSVDDRIEAPKAFLGIHEYPWRQAFGGTLDGKSAWSVIGVEGIPSLWLIGPDGKILAKTGDVDGQYQLQYLDEGGKVVAKEMSNELLDSVVKKALASP
jgi:thiol-disulfide isomerase/thioredoxin